MERAIIRIDEDRCNGCGDCVPSCAEGALRIVDGKARLVSEVLCDGLGACLGHCPQDAIIVETRDAAPFSEAAVARERQAAPPAAESACPGSRNRSLPSARDEAPEPAGPGVRSALRQWPVQLHLINPLAPHFAGTQLLVAADCVAYALGDFHQKFLRGKSLVIACPKLDSHLEVYVEKIQRLVDAANVASISVMIMEVPCCRGLVEMVRQGVARAGRRIPLTVTVIGVAGEVQDEISLATDGATAQGPRSSLLYR